jgi:hypothetical protein
LHPLRWHAKAADLGQKGARVYQQPLVYVVHVHFVVNVLK